MFPLNGPKPARIKVRSSSPPTVVDQPNLELARIATQLRKLYVQLKAQIVQVPAAEFDRSIPSWDGGTDAYERKHKAVWPQLAAKVLAAGCDLRLFMRAQVVAGKLSPPNSLCGPAAFERYRLYKIAVGEEEPVRLKSQVLQLKLSLLRATNEAALTPTEAVVPGALLLKALLDSRAQLTPLFRYCTASRAGLLQVQQIYRDSALEQLIASYDLCISDWRELLDPQLVKEAQAVRDMAARN